jgi:hypothetical protein
MLVMTQNASVRYGTVLWRFRFKAVEYPPSCMFNGTSYEMLITGPVWLVYHECSSTSIDSLAADRDGPVVVSFSL